MAQSILLVSDEIFGENCAILIRDVTKYMRNFTVVRSRFIL